MPAYTSERERYEKALSIAHRWLWVALGVAQQQQWDGDSADLEQILVEVTRVCDASLKEGRRKPRRSPVGPK